MDLSINNINLNKKNINFKGLEGAYNESSVPVYKFYAPAHSKDEKVYLEFSYLEKDEATAQYKAPKNIRVVPFGDDDVIELSQETARKAYSGFGYRYRIVSAGKNEIKLDPFRTIQIDEKGNKMNVIEQGRNYGISPKGGSMRHSFLDSDVRLDSAGDKKLAVNKDFVRNHFNKLGGSIKGLNWLLKNTDELKPYRYLMTTPDIGD